MKFDADSTACLLQELAFEISARRRWNCFMRDHDVIATSWVGIGSGYVIFEEGVRSLWVEPLMPAVNHGFRFVFSSFDYFVSCEMNFRSNDFMHICYESGPCLQTSHIISVVPEGNESEQYRTLRLLAMGRLHNKWSIEAVMDTFRYTFTYLKCTSDLIKFRYCCDIFPDTLIIECRPRNHIVRSCNTAYGRCRKSG